MNMTGYINRWGVPIYALTCSALVSVVTFVTSLIPGKALYSVLTSLSGVAGFVTWAGIALSHYRFRLAFKAQNKDFSIIPIRAPYHPFGDLFVMVACCVIALMTGYSYFYPPDPVGLVGNYAGIILCAIGWAITKWWTKSKMIPPAEIDVDTGVSDQIGKQEEEKTDITGNFFQRMWKRLLIIFT